MTEPGPAVTAGEGAGNALDTLLRRCVQCGLCLPVCATWLVTGDETMSPRGRLLLLGQWLEDPEAAVGEPSWRQALDTCIGCRACSGVCPSGVPHELLEAGAAAARAGITSRLPAGAPARRAVTRLDTPGRLRALGAAAAAARQLLALVPTARRLARTGRPGPLERLRRAVGTVPRAPRSDRELLRRLDALCGVVRASVPSLPASSPVPRETLLWFAGCANEGLLPASSRRLRDLLSWAGADLITAPGAACCGALADHGGDPARAERLRERNLAAWGDGGGAAAIVTEAAGCGVAIAGYGGALPLPQVDAIAWLAGRRLPPLGAVPLRVALHDPCHARHGQGLVREPRLLLKAVPGLTLLEPDEADACCGSGGLWSLSHPELAAEAGLRKARLLAATGADLVVTANPGCLGQIAGSLERMPGRRVPILPLGDLLWYAAVRAGQPDGGRDGRRRGSLSAGG